MTAKNRQPVGITRSHSARESRTLGLLVALLLALGPTTAEVALAQQNLQTDIENLDAEKLAQQVKRLVQLLDSDKRIDRIRAEARLLRLGSAALRYLPDPEAKDAPALIKRPAVKQALQKIRRSLQERAAREFTVPSTVTLTGEFPLDELLPAISKQTGNQLVDFRGQFGQPKPNPKLKVQFHQTPFWEAIDEVSRQAKLEVYPYAQTGALGLVQQQSTNNPAASLASTDGPFRVVPTQLICRNDLRSTDSPTCSVSGELLWEPRLNPIVAVIEAASISAFDDRGNAIPFAGTPSAVELLLSNDTPVQPFELPLVAPPREATKIASLKAKLKMIVPGKPHTFTFADLKPKLNTQQARGNVTVVIQDVREENEGVWSVRMVLQFDEGETGVESYRHWVLENPVQLLDPGGQVVPSAGLETTLRTEREYGVAYLFQTNTVAGHKFVYTTPVTVSQVTRSFELKDLKLP